MAYIEKESKKSDIGICITDALFCTTETNTIFYVNYTAIKINFKKRKRPHKDLKWHRVNTVNYIKVF